MSEYCKNCYELAEQLDQLKEELAISIQENEEGREINAELKKENETLKKLLEEENCHFDKIKDLINEQ